MSAARRRACVEHVSAKLDVSERFACKMVGQHRSTQRKAPETADDEAALTGAVVELAREYGRYGYRRVTALLRAEGWACVNGGDKTGQCGGAKPGQLPVTFRPVYQGSVSGFPGRLRPGIRAVV